MEYTSPDYDKNQEIQEEIKKVERKDFKKSWVSSSAFLFYLSVACLILFTWGGCYRLSTKRFHKPEVPVQESTLYTPKYK
ncbi:MAG: hypothetical protein QM727_01870 [Niabella sp.]